ncbi:HAD-IIIC family phosphatase [Anaeromicropila populeti]|uniref:HAD-superfamily phosphatase, subfamily IIIC/FkbH-like domain-containing protein n=1 Tax=Anaeromicropila populeti TaxID=37658 RepID=A0A1I6LGF0_9FIRM|nr:HAD-IIIC family phosphatase [Anaeromicropila populeti]SFS02504.1 HAD-superfamily phosphatase, subfamily IIIC/FkbH-like domain-containing protein [Anaeromicropila populeti]
MEKDVEIKCVVWDLDNTIWQGVLMEGSNVSLMPEINEIIKTLDSRGILQAIASKNDYELAIEKLRELGLEEYFIYPEIHWDAKSFSIANIQKNINIGMNTILFVDDQEFELEEVQTAHPEVTCIHAKEYKKLLDNPRLNPRFITVDSARRRKMYQDDYIRKQAEKEYKGPSNAFLATLNMKFTISEAGEEDLKRAEELTVRTNQLNATGVTYSYEELNVIRKSSQHKLLVCELEDKYGTYGKIGLALIHMLEDHWKLEMMLMSCRVVSRGVGTVLLSYIMKEAKKQNKYLLADFRDTGRNRMMNVSFRFAGFQEKFSDGQGTYVLENNLENIQEYPDYIELYIK